MSIIICLNSFALDEIISKTIKKYDLERKEGIEQQKNKTNTLLANLKETYSIQPKAVVLIAWIAIFIFIAFYLFFIIFDMMIFLYFKSKTFLKTTMQTQKMNKFQRKIEDDNFSFIKLREADLIVQKKYKRFLKSRTENA